MKTVSVGTSLHVIRRHHMCVWCNGCRGLNKGQGSVSLLQKLNDFHLWPKINGNIRFFSECFYNILIITYKNMYGICKSVIIYSTVNM